MKRLAALLAAGALGWLAGSAVHAQAARTFKGRLSPVPVAAASPNVTGKGSVTATLTGTKLTISGTFEGLASPATGAKLHRSAKAGIRGPALFDLTVTPAAQGTVTGSVELTPAQADDLGRNQFYVQIQSEKAPEGNLWGWLFSQENKR